MQKDILISLSSSTRSNQIARNSEVRSSKYTQVFPLDNLYVIVSKMKSSEL